MLAQNGISENQFSKKFPSAGLLVGRGKKVKFRGIFREKFAEKMANFAGIFEASFAEK